VPADARLSVQSGGSRAAARWTKEITISSSAKPTGKQGLEKLPNPVDVIPSKVAPPPTQKHSSKEQKSVPTASSSHCAEPSWKFSTKAPVPTQKHLSMELEPAPMASSSNRPKSSQKASTKVPKSVPVIVDSNSDDGVDIPPPTRNESGGSTKKSLSESSVPRKAPDRTSSSKPQRPAPVNDASETDNGGALSKALDPDLKQAVLLDIQAIVARHMACVAQVPREEFGGKVDEESISSDSTCQDDGDIVMVDGNQDELWSEEEMAMKESPQIPHMSEKQKGK